MKTEREIQIFLTIAFFAGSMGMKEDLEFSSLDVAKLATRTYGSELLLLENSLYTEQIAYKFEDFFWTGSGDGPDDENDMWTSDDPAIIYKTSTIISTVFVETPNTLMNSTPTPNCSLSLTCSGDNKEISPTPTLNSNASQQFWLLTVIQNNGKDPVIDDLKNSLAELYKIAFLRQQARHLGLRQKRSSPNNNVNVFIHEINKQKSNIELVYHVEVSGEPVDAFVAANDMKLVTDDEVRQELGFAFDVKAEPYVKPSEPQGLSNKAKNTWFVIGGSIIGVLLILLVLAFVSLGFAKRKRLHDQEDTNFGTENKRHIFERGHENKGLVKDEEIQNKTPSPTYVNFADQHVTSVILRPQSSFSRTSSSSSSLDISPLTSSTKKPAPKRPRAALNKTVPLNIARQLPTEVFDSDSSTSRKDESPDFGENFDPGIVSPKSYLSMPSVKSFPRTIMPEPLNKVLEPVSVTHLDMPDGETTQEHYLIRHGSVGAMEDPGVIGPIVWNMHCDRLQHGVSVDRGINDHQMKSANNISRMRRRFHDLLDDTFSLFGSSRKGSPVDERSHPVPIEVKSHSAIEKRQDTSPTLRPRPKTTGNKKPDLSAPSCAWTSTAPSPLVRPLSAAPRITSGVFPGAPRVNVEHVLAEGKFRTSDPAISVIEAIKNELKNVSLPESSEQLNK